jgi:glycosyltransferase involved in cell wall biosynthesis
MTLAMKVSFIIPAFNEEKYIADCLAAIFKLQDLQEFEIIVADNNSMDKTKEVVASKFPRARIVNAEKKGPAAARNAGAATASGEYLAFLDADCRVPRDWWGKVQKQFEKDPNIALLYGPYRYYEVTGLPGRMVYYLSNVIVFWLGEIFLRKLFGLGGGAFGVFDKVGGFDERFRFYSEDSDLSRRVMKFGRVTFVPDTWVYSSNRRFQHVGTIKLWWIYVSSTASNMLFGKAVDQDPEH